MPVCAGNHGCLPPETLEMSMFVIFAALLVFTALFVALSLFPHAGEGEMRGVSAGIETKSRSRP